MIFELMKLFEKELGTSVPKEAAYRIESALCEKFGGERMYVPKLPKLVAQVKIASLGTGMSASALARELGVSPQWVRRIVRRQK